MREIINKQQADILRTLQAKPGLTRLELANTSGVPRQKVLLEVPELIERYLIDYASEPGCQAQKISITEYGAKALEDHIKHQAWLASDHGKVPSARRNLFEFPVYAPPKSGYCRNEGTFSIPSKGCKC